MTTLKNPNHLLQRLASISYRASLALIATYLVVSKNISFFTPEIYAIAIAAYCLLILALYTQQRTTHFIRLLTDYTFITLILYGNPINSLTKSVILLFPIINAPNHTGPRRGISLHITALISALIATQLTYTIDTTISFIPIFLSGLFTYISASIAKINSDIHRSIDSFFSDYVPDTKLHRVLEDVRLALNKYLFIEIAYIACIKIINASPTITHSSGFIKSSDLDKHKEFIQCATPKKYATVTNFQVNGEQYPVAAITCVGGDKTNRFFIVIFKFPPPKLILHITTYHSFNLFFSRVSRCLDIEEKIQIRDREHYKKVKNNIEYVETAYSVLHFIKNKTGPLSGVIQLLKLMDTDTPDSNKKQKNNEILARMTTAAESALEQIDQVANKHLERKLRLDDTPPESISNKTLIALIRTIWAEHISPENRITISDTLNLDMRFMARTDGLHMILNDIISNIAKHKKSVCAADISHDDSGNLLIDFSNDFHDPQKIEQVISFFEFGQKKEILQRTTQGLVLLKRFIEHMEFSCTAFISDDKFHLRLSVPMTSTHSGGSNASNSHI